MFKDLRSILVHSLPLYCILAVIVVPVCITTPPAAVQAGVSSPKVAMVNGVVISQDAFDKELTLVKQRIATMGKKFDERQMAELKQKILESMINRELLYQESRKKGIAVENASILKQMDAMKGKFPNEDAYKNALLKMELSESDLRNQIERELAIQQLIDQQLASKTIISDAEAKAFYEANPNFFKQPEQVQASQILIKVDPKADESKKKAAQQELSRIRKRVLKGEDFAELAKSHSQGPSSEKGGDLGFFRRGQMVKAFEEAAFSLEPGEVSQIVETQFGFHIIKVTGKKPETTLAYKDVKDNLQQYLKQQKVKQGVDVYIEKLKEDAEVERFPKGMP